MKIPNDSKVHLIEYTPKFSVICSIGKAPFHGMIKIKFMPGDWLLEFEAFEKFLKDEAMHEYTVESLCRFIFEKLLLVLVNPSSLVVSVCAQTMVHADVTATIEYYGSRIK